MMPRFAALATLAMLAACATSPESPQARGDCGDGPLRLVNLSSQPVEQFYLGTPPAWGADLLNGAVLEPRATLDLRRSGAANGLRAVWVNGRAVELAGLNLCSLHSAQIGDGGIQVQ